MKKRKFGNTDLLVSEVGFGAWGIGGPAMAGAIPIGWGKVDDAASIRALEKSVDLGINFFDTADFYGFGHSEELIGKVLGNRRDVIIATKVGHRLANGGSIVLDYSKAHILKACEASLKKLQRDAIDYYQLHSAKREHLEKGECVEAMRMLQAQGKIRYWGISLNTFNPHPEAEFMMQQQLGSGFQIVLNIINQRALELIRTAHMQNYGIIARMPLQFGLLTGKFAPTTRFDKNDHRHFRLPPALLEAALHDLAEVWPLCKKYKISPTSLSLSFILSFPEVSTVIPGIKTVEQAVENTTDIVQLQDEDIKSLMQLYHDKLCKLVDLMERIG
ncbi:aldo/keto reductase [candidate division KSB1 bacterium]|nr:aldo/keto reductase [candidate division KSB1 bacterium]